VISAAFFAFSTAKLPNSLVDGGDGDGFGFEAEGELAGIEPAVTTNSLCWSAEEIIVRELEVQIGNFGRDGTQASDLQTFQKASGVVSSQQLKIFREGGNPCCPEAKVHR